MNRTIVWSVRTRGYVSHSPRASARWAAANHFSGRTRSRSSAIALSGLGAEVVAGSSENGEREAWVQSSATHKTCEHHVNRLSQAVVLNELLGDSYHEE